MLFRSKLQLNKLILLPEILSKFPTTVFKLLLLYNIMSLMLPVNI
ncbi:unnamed protein product [Commensalibacter communis]|nr:unnamed protein product [Commensalibacter communis]CAI3936808.1 unnamed protein product [Commensalibacter communis]